MANRLVERVVANVVDEIDEVLLSVLDGNEVDEVEDAVEDETSEEADEVVDDCTDSTVALDNEDVDEGFELVEEDKRPVVVVTVEKVLNVVLDVLELGEVEDTWEALPRVDPEDRMRTELIMLL